MAGTAVAWGTKAAMVPAGALHRGRVAGAGVAAATAAGAGAVVGLGRVSLRLQSKRVGFPSFAETRRSLTIVAVKTEGQTEIVSEVTEPDMEAAGSELKAKAEDILKQAKSTWEKVDDKLAIGSLGVVAVLALYGSIGLISSVDKLPLIPQLLELVGLLYTGNWFEHDLGRFHANAFYPLKMWQWFVYRYLLFKPDREEVFKVVDDTKKKITGQDDL